jgi:hypothetical protein
MTMITAALSGLSGLSGLAGALIKVIIDTLTDADGTALTAHTMDLGGGWTTITANGVTATIQGNRGRLVQSSGGNSQALCNPGTPTATIQAIVNCATAGEDFGLVARVTDADNKWMVHLDLTTNTAYVYEVVGGSTTQRASGSFGGSANTDYAMALSVGGSNIVFSINGAQIVSFNSMSTGLTATKVGISIGGRISSPTVNFDNVTVTSP